MKDMMTMMRWRWIKVIRARPESVDDEIWQKGNKMPEYPSLNTAGDLTFIEACVIRDSFPPMDGRKVRNKVAILKCEIETNPMEPSGAWKKRIYIV